VAAADLERAESIARSIEDLSGRLSALAAVAAVADPKSGARLVTEAETVAKQLPFAQDAMIEVVEAAVAVDVERAEAIARSITHGAGGVGPWL
jgi:hypothetical protein